MKKFKKFILSFAAAIFVLSSSVLASSSGDNLKNWYQGLFKTFASFMENIQLPNWINDAGNEFNSLKNSLINSLPSSFEAIKNQVIVISNMDIFRRSGVYIDQVLNTKEAIKSEIPAAYTNYKQQKQDEINSELDDITKSCITEITDALDEEVKKTTQQLLNSSTNAQNTLKSSIESAKDSINSNIVTNETKTQKQLQSFIDNSFEEIKREVTQDTEILKVNLIEDIQREGKAIEESAKKDMNNLILKINN